MTDEEIDRYFEALDKNIRLLGPTSFDEGVRAFYPWLSSLVQRIGVFQNREIARQFLRDLPPAESGAMNTVLSRISGLVYEIRDLLPDLTKRLPYPPGGRPTVRTPETDEQIAKEVERLTTAKGQRKLFAYKVVADRHDISTTTVQRICKEHKKKPEC